MKYNGKHYRTVWLEDNKVKMINQPLIPHQFEITTLDSHLDTANAITNMTVRGAGAIGAAGAYGLAQAVLEAPDNDYISYIDKAYKTLENTRPTAQNLFYGLNMVMAAIKNTDNITAARKEAVTAAQKVADEDSHIASKIGEFGNEIIIDGFNILTHCNAGWLAFVDWGTALSPIYKAFQAGKKVFVYVDETRPRCQGARITSWELDQENIPHTIIADNAAGYYMQHKKIDMVITGADRIAVNGDTANKIGTYTKAVLAKENNIPFYIAAPTTTVDPDCPDGEHIPIEERDQDEVLYIWGKTKNNEIEKIRIAPEGVKANNPAFDVTPAKYIKGIITEKGIVNPDKSAIQAVLS